MCVNEWMYVCVCVYIFMFTHLFDSLKFNLQFIYNLFPGRPKFAESFLWSLLNVNDVKQYLMLFKIMYLKIHFSVCLLYY